MEIEQQDTNAEAEAGKKAQELVTLMKIAEQTNIFDMLDAAAQAKLGQNVIKFADKDEQSRKPWLDKSKIAMELALQEVERKTSPWDGASNVKYPLITVAALQFHARAYPAIVGATGVVKGKVTGLDSDGEKAKQASRIAQHMNWQLLEENESWEEDTDKLLLALPIEGCEFKKSYFSPEDGYNLSEWVRPADLIVSNTTKTLKKCPRITHRVWFYPYRINELMFEGTWSEVDLNISPDDEDEEVLQEFYEQHVFINILGGRRKLPFIVTAHVASKKVVRVAPGFHARDIVVNVGGQEGTLASLMASVDEEQFMQSLGMAKVVRVPRVEMFTKFGFIPSPDGSFYDIGFGQLIGPLSDSVDTNINQLLDAGTLANQQCGFIAEGVSIEHRRGDIEYSRGRFKTVKLPANQSLNNAIYQIKFPEPSLVLFQLLGTLIQSAKDITSVQDIMTGRGQKSGQTATTSTIQIEQGLMVFSSIYKRIYRSQGQEFKKLFKLNSVYLTPEQYFKVLDTQADAVIQLRDYRGDGTNVQPVADPQLATSVLAMAKNEAMMRVMPHALVNDEEVLKRYFQALDVPEPELLIIPPEKRQAPPDPELVLKANIAASEHAKRVAEIATLYATALEKVANAEATEIGQQLQAYANALQAVMQGFTNGQQQSSTMAAQPANQGGIQGIGGTEAQALIGGDGVA